MKSLSTDQKLIQTLHIHDHHDRNQLIASLPKSSITNLLSHVASSTSWSPNSAAPIDQQLDQDHYPNLIILYNHTLQSVIIYDIAQDLFQYHLLKDLHTITVHGTIDSQPYVDALPGNWFFPKPILDFANA
tara:strand:+ start:4567 stop:4959 length:393 start_codon:yes stop_codon:yes gene_type:complete